MFDRKVDTVFFDTKRVRHNGTVCRDKNFAPVMPVKPMSFLVNYGQIPFPNKPVRSVSKPKVIFVALRQIPKNHQLCKK